MEAWICYKNDLSCFFSRVMEILLSNNSLTSKLRMPAVSRLQKVHNVDMALLALKSSRAGSFFNNFSSRLLYSDNCPIVEWSATVEIWGRFLVRFSLSECHRDSSIKFCHSLMLNFFTSKSCKKSQRTATDIIFAIEKSTPGFKS